MWKIRRLRRLYDFIVEKWLIHFFLVSASANWLVLVKISGKKFGWVDSTGEMNPWVWWVSIGLFSFSTAFAVLKALADRHDHLGKERGQQLLQLLLSSTTTLVVHRVEELRRRYGVKSSDSEVCRFRDPTEGGAQLEFLLWTLRDALSEIFGIRKDDISVTLMYLLGGSSEWFEISVNNAEKELTVEELLRNPKTTAFQVVDGEMSFISFPDKRLGISCNQYIASRRDRVFENIGSIVCIRLDFGSAAGLPRGILCISGSAEKRGADYFFDRLLDAGAGARRLRRRSARSRSCH